MARLIGAQRMVLQAIVDLPVNSAGFVTDAQIAQHTQIAASDVRDWIETLEGEGLVNVAKTTSGLSASITANGRLALGQYRPFPSAPAPPAADTPADTRGIDQRQGVDVIDSSGNWVLLGSYFFQAKSIKQGSGVLTVVIPSRDSQNDAALQALSGARSRGGASVVFAHRNDVWVVAVEDIESESAGEGLDWTIRLRPKDHANGGGPGEFGKVVVNGHELTAEQIAEKRAGRILLNDPPPMAYDHRKHDTATMMEMYIRGVNVTKPVDRCPLRDLYAVLGDDQSPYLHLARLAAVFALKAGDVVERVERLSLGPIRDGHVHVAFAGKRRQKYPNVDPYLITLQGDCPLA
jgi:hypothetical protein